MSMDIRERQFGSIATLRADGQTIDVDLDALIRRLLLFELCYLESSQLRELPAMLKAFGYKGVMRLLEDPSFEIICDAMTAGSIGQTAVLQITQQRGHVLPLGSYRIVLVSLATKNGYHDALANVPRMADVSNQQYKRLKVTLVNKLMQYPREAGEAGMADFAREIETDGARLVPALRHVARTDWSIDVGTKLRVEVERLPFEGDYRVHTNLQTDFGMTEAAAHKAVEKALLGLAGLDQRIRLMETFSAVTGFQDAEAPIFEAKLSFIADQLNPTTQEQRFERISTLAGLPSLSALGTDATVDMEKLLRLRDHPDCVDLRRWLRSTDGQSDEDIKQQFNSVKEQLAALTHSPVGKAVRFVATNAAGIVPHAGIVLGPAATLADQFIAEKLIGSPGPVCFLSHQYRSIYRP